MNYQPFPSIKFGGHSSFICESESALDALYGPAIQRGVALTAVDAGRRAARASWHELRHQVIRLDNYCRKLGVTLQWGQPWPNANIAMHVYIVENGNRVIGCGDLFPFTHTRADCLFRRFQKNQERYLARWKENQ